MSMEAIARFYEAVRRDEQLQLKVAALSGRDFPQALAALGREHGHDFTAAEVDKLTAAGAAEAERELDEKALDAVVGGGLSADSGALQFSNLYHGLRLESTNLADPLLAPRGPPMMPARS